VNKYITNWEQSVFLPWQEGMIEWLHENYPYSKYHIVEVT